MCVFAPLGFALFLIGTLGRTSDSDMDNIVRHKTDKVELNFDDDKKLERRLAKHLPLHIVEGYEYKDGLMLKKAKSGILRSNEYYKTAIYTFDTELRIVVRKVDLINEAATTDTYIFPFTDITSISVNTEKLNLTYNRKKYMVHADHLSVKNGDESLLTVSLHSDILIEQYIEKLNEHINASKNQ